VFGQSSQNARRVANPVVRPAAFPLSDALLPQTFKHPETSILEGIAGSAENPGIT
jgi:hypothetical protein